MDEADRGNVDLHALSPGDLFAYFCEKSIDVGPILEAFQILLNKLQLGSSQGLQRYEELKSKLTTWKAKSLWELLDKKIKQKEYCQQDACKGMRVLIVGAGPVGMRLAIECILLGCEAVIVEKRHYFSRNNVLHLWPFTIDDLRRLGAKKFYGQFCAGAIDHISIRTLQSMMLKICLMFGIQIYFNVEFQNICEPKDSMGWHAQLSPSNHELNNMDFHVLIGAEGRTSRIPGFDRKELRAKLALAITANFVNYHSTEEAAVQEISGVAFIFNQKFFKELKEDTGIDLENLVYYKDDTHYFIMTAKKESLLQKGVLKEDFPDPYDLLAPSNRNIKAMYDYSREAADWSTELPQLEFALNHKHIPDVDLFDFTSVYQAEYAARAVRRKGKDLLICLVGDSLVNPFWPQGTGCARGFLSAMDAAWMIRGLGKGRKMLELLAERESLYQKLTQTQPENLMKNFAQYTIDPHSRYPNLHFNVMPHSVLRLYDTDDASTLPRMGTLKRITPPTDNEEMVPEKKMKQEKSEPQTEAMEESSSENTPISPLHSVNEKGHISRALYGTPEEKAQLVDMSVLMKWFKKELKGYNVRITTLDKSFQSGLVLCSLIHRYFPELIPGYSSLTEKDKMHNNQLAFSILDQHLAIPQLLKASEMLVPDRLALFTYLSSVYEAFQDQEPAEVPMEIENEPPKPSPSKRKLFKRTSQYKHSTEESWNTRTPRKSLSPEKHHSLEKRLSAGKKVKRSLDLEEKVEEQEESTKKSPPPSVQAPAATDKAKALFNSTPTSKPKEVATTATPTAPSMEIKRPGAIRSTPRPVSTFGSPTTASDMCFFCGKRVYLMERMSANGVFFHRPCFRCSHCNTQLNLGHYSMSKGQSGEPGKFFCPPHYRQLFLSNPQAINYARVGTPTTVTTPSPVDKEPPKDSDKPQQAPSPSDSSLQMSIKKQEVVGDDQEHQLSRSMSLAQRVRTFWRSRKSRKSLSPKRESLSPSPQPSAESVADQSLEEPPVTHTSTGEQKSDEAPPKPSRKRTLERASVELVKDTTHKQSPESTAETLTEAEKLDVSPSSSPSMLSGDSSPGQQKPRSSTARPARPAPPPPYHRTHRSLSSLEVIPEQDRGSPEAFRHRSPGVMSNRPGTTPSPAATSSRKRKPRGQRIITRPMKNEDNDVVIRDRQKQQERFLEAQTIQREMSQIELQYEEMEDIGREVEQNLRDAEGTAQEDHFMKAWLNLVSERNSLVRRTAELNLQKKVLELEDKQYELEKEMREMDVDEVNEELLESLVKVIEERSDIVQQVEQERQMEMEEDQSHISMLVNYFGEEYEGTPGGGHRQTSSPQKKQKSTRKWWHGLELN